MPEEEDRFDGFIPFVEAWLTGLDLEIYKDVFIEAGYETHSDVCALARHKNGAQDEVIELCHQKHPSGPLTKPEVKAKFLTSLGTLVSASVRMSVRRGNSVTQVTTNFDELKFLFGDELSMYMELADITLDVDELVQQDVFNQSFGSDLDLDELQRSNEARRNGKERTAGNTNNLAKESLHGFNESLHGFDESIRGFAGMGLSDSVHQKSSLQLKSPSNEKFQQHLAQRASEATGGSTWVKPTKPIANQARRKSVGATEDFEAMKASLLESKKMLDQGFNADPKIDRSTTTKRL
eukprot:m.17202 g.17202  ORF g.17202 m.17202 type:complete len:294 (+) comp5938_c0_seq2:319-1200(+)